MFFCACFEKQKEKKNEKTPKIRKYVFKNIKKKSEWKGSKSSQKIKTMAEICITHT